MKKVKNNKNKINTEKCDKLFSNILNRRILIMSGVLNLSRVTPIEIPKIKVVISDKY